MSTRRQTDWGTPDVRDDDPLLGSSPSGASGSLYGLLQNFVRLPGFGKLIPRGRAGDLSQGVNGGIDMDRINRSVLGPLIGRTSPANYAVAATSWAEIDSVNLVGTMACTGRPVIVLVACAAARGTAPSILISVTMDGNEITGTTDGLGIIDLTTAADFNLVNWDIITPPAGLHRFAFVAKVSSGSGTIWSSTDDQVRLAVVEI